MTQQTLIVEQRPIEKLIPYAKNARTHSEQQIAQIAASIREFGFTNPVLIDEADGIIAGHGRVLAARKLAMTHVPVIELCGLSEVQKRAYVLADNQLALEAGWDDAMLTAELESLLAAEFDVAATGFSKEELDRLLAPAAVDFAGDDTGKLTDSFEVLVSCADESQQAQLLERLTAEGFACRSLIS